HYLAEVEKVCHRVGLVKDGRLITEESVSRLKERMVRRMEILFDAPVSREDILTDNIDILEQDGSRMVLGVTGEIDPLLKRISRFRVRNLVFPEPSLEDTFMTFYRKE
ncbi:MAG: hypothetical protein MI892_21830, partial [Desulfobacterales bacterium]|nr:hypothetical protein [Desulfobacterales bacterium]